MSRRGTDVVLPRRRSVVVMAASLHRHRAGVLRAARSVQTESHHRRSQPHEVAQQTEE